MARGLTVTGEIVEVPEDLFRIRDEIEDRWPNLWVTYLNPDHATSSARLGPCLGDPPFQIWERTKTGPQLVFSVWKLDQSVIDRLHLMNGANVDVFAEVEKNNAALRRKAQQEAEESFAEGSDQARSALSHFAKGKIEFKYTNEHGEKRVIRHGQHGSDRSRSVL